MPKARCPQCATVVTYAAGYDPICPQCGFRGAAPVPIAPPAAWTALPATPAPAASYAPPPLAQPAYAHGTAPVGPQQGMAVAALVCGLAALFIPFVGLVAAILGGVALGNADRDPQRYGGKGMATAGLVLGILFSIFWFMAFGFGDLWDDDPWWFDW